MATGAENYATCGHPKQELGPYGNCQHPGYSRDFFQSPDWIDIQISEKEEEDEA